MQYAYLIGAGILGLFWLLIFVRRKDLRKELTFGGLLGIPFGMTEFFYIPEYWNPPSVFNLIDKIGFGIESVLFGFFVGGIAASLFEFLEKKRLVSIHKHQNNEDHYVPYLLLIIFYLSLELTLPLYTIYNLSFSMLLAAFLWPW